MTKPLVNLATIRPEYADNKTLCYVAFALNAAADQVRAVLDTSPGFLGDDSCEAIWNVYESLKQSAIALERPFDANCYIEVGSLCGPGGGFAHLDDTVSCYLEYREKYEEN